MRQILTAAAVAAGLIALWAVVVPLTAKPAPAQAASQSTASQSEVLSKALFLCRGPHGIDRACTAALAQALVLDEPASKVTRVSDQLCPADPHILVAMVRHR
jgi:hypothetical protein